MNNDNENLNVDDILEDMSAEDKEKAQEIYDKGTQEAEELLNDVDKMERFLQKLEKKLKTVPIAGNALVYIPLMMSLVRSYVKKEYTEIPAASAISITFSLLYFLAPVDVIPDFIPGVGHLDDAAVIVGCLALVRTDLEDYRIWRKNNGFEYDDLPDYEEIIKDADSQSKFAKAFFMGRKSKKII